MFYTIVKQSYFQMGGPPMSKTCQQCHYPINSNSQFCKVCGAVTPKPSYQRPLIYSITALILIITMVVGLWRPGYFWILLEKNPSKVTRVPIEKLEILKPNIKITSNDLKKAKLTTANITPDQPAIEVDDLAIDFGAYNLFGDNQLEVRKLAPKKDDAFGCTAQAYDFKLEETSEFANLVNITLPYEDCPDAEDRMVVMYYNETSEDWEPIPYTIDTQNHTVAFETDHFSTFALFDMYIYEGGNYTGPLTRAIYNPVKLGKMLSSMDSALFYKMLEAKQVPLMESANSTLGTLNNFTSATSHSLTTHSLLTPFTSEFASRLSNKLGYLGMALVTLKVGTSWYNTESISQTISDNAYDLAEMGVSIGAMAVGGVFLNVAAAGIWIYSFGSSNLQSYLDRGYDNTIEEKFNFFSETNVTYVPSQGRFGFQLKADQVKNMKDLKLYVDRQADEFHVETLSHWNYILKRIYNKYKDDPRKLSQAIDYILADYTSVFWRIPGETQKRYVNDRSISALIFGSKEATQEQKTLYSERLRAKTIKKLEPLFKKYYELSMHEAQQKAINTIFDTLDELNQVIEFQIEIKDAKGKNIKLSDSPYKDYIIMFDMSNSTLPDQWFCDTSSKSNTVFKCTLYSYLLAGSPSNIKFYKFLNDTINGEPEFVVDFKTDLPVTTISLSDDLKFEDILGSWDMTQTVENFSSSFTNDLVDQMKDVPGMSDYADQYSQIMGDVNGNYEGTMVISQAADGGEVADVRFIHAGYDESTSALYRGAWSQGQLQLDPADGLLGGSWTLTFVKDASGISCQGSSTFESDLASYSYTLSAKKQ